MLLAWMVMTCVFTLCVAVAAYATDRLRQAHRRATRGVWATALAIAVSWPLLIPVMRPLLSSTSATQSMAPSVGGVADGGIGVITAERTTRASKTLVQQIIDGPVAVEGAMISVARRSPWLVPVALAAWAVASSALLLRLLLAAHRITTLTRTAVRTTIDQQDVLLSDGFGPASVGVRSPRIVLPQWVIALDAPLRALVLQHEREHCESGDPRFVWSAAVATTLLPWNPVVWWLSRRLRLALELDCDVRTLKHGGDPLVYAKLLLFMTQQHAAPASHLRLASSLAVSRSHLSRRIVAMQQGAVRSSRTMRLALGGAAVLAIAGACGTRIPGNAVSPKNDAESAVAVQTRADSTSVSVAVTAESALSNPYTESQVEKPVAVITSGLLQYPEMLQSAQLQGKVLASFVVDEQGLIDTRTFNVLRSDHELFTNSVRQSLSQFKYSPAELDGKRVKQLVQQPFVFSLDEVQRSSAEKTDRAAVAQLQRRIEATAIAQRESLPMKPSDPSQPYFEYQVATPAAMSANPTGMVYPPELRAARVEGRVLASFVVDVNGEVEMSTFKVLRSDHALFTAAVKDALAGMKYLPAEAEGKRVRQVVQQPFQFSLAR